MLKQSSKKKKARVPFFDPFNITLLKYYADMQQEEERAVLEMINMFAKDKKPKPWSPVGGQSVHCAGRSKYGIVGPGELSHGTYTGGDKTWYRVKLHTGQDDYFQLEQLSPYETSVEEIVRRLRA